VGAPPLSAPPTAGPPQTPPVVRYPRDATDRIVQREINGRTIARYSYSGAGDTSDLTLDGSSNLVESTIKLPGGAIYTWRSSASVWSYPNTHGDLALTTDSSGSKQGPTRVWDPWGRALTSTFEQDNSAGQLDYGWHGNSQRPLEQQSGAILTVEMGARSYDPVLGRFWSADSVEGGTPNDYVYSPNPLTEPDLDGRAVPRWLRTMMIVIFGVEKGGKLFKSGLKNVRQFFTLATRQEHTYQTCTSAGFFIFSEQSCRVATETRLTIITGKTANNLVFVAVGVERRPVFSTQVCGGVNASAGVLSGGVSRCRNVESRGGWSLSGAFSGSIDGSRPIGGSTQGVAPPPLPGYVWDWSR